MRQITLMIALVGALFGGPALADNGDLVVTDARSRATPPTVANGVGYLAIENRGDSADRLIGAETERAETVELHETRQDGEIMRMRPLPEGIELPSGERVTLEPGGRHLMLVGLKTPLMAGETVPLTLDFERAGKLTIELQVEPLVPGREPMQHEGHN